MKPLTSNAAVVDDAVRTEVYAACSLNASAASNWVVNAAILWDRRHLLVRVASIALLISLLIAFTLPKQYKSSARIMPPNNSGISTAVLAALAGRASGLSGIGALAGSLFGTNSTSPLLVDLLRSGTVAGRLIDRFDLQHVYHKRYRVDTAKYLARHTDIVDDKKTGVITISVDDTDPRRARDITQAYLDELNHLINRTSTSSAHQERVFIEKRLTKARADLEDAQQRMSAFSSTHATVDLKEQTRAVVESGARIQAQVIVEQSNLNSLRQIYGDANIRVRAAEARIAVLQKQLATMSGSPAPLSNSVTDQNGGNLDGDNQALYPPLRQLPRLAVPYADLYREVQVQEAVFELLTQQYELARIQEAKDVPVISVIDGPGIPEKKSFPPRLLVAVLLTSFAFGTTCALLLVQYRWALVPAGDLRKVLVKQIVDAVSGSWIWRAVTRKAVP
jgi:uncharacterized protein involved in exopolysaccharide biosynthesis